MKIQFAGCLKDSRKLQKNRGTGRESKENEEDKKQKMADKLHIQTKDEREERP